jgi:hypothetical protein
MGEWRYSSTIFTSALNGGEWAASRFCHLTPGDKALGMHWIGGLVIVRNRLDAMEKRNITYPSLELNPSLPVRSFVAISTDLPRSYHPPCSSLNVTDQDWHSPNNM